MQESIQGLLYFASKRIKNSLPQTEQKVQLILLIDVCHIDLKNYAKKHLTSSENGIICTHQQRKRRYKMAYKDLTDAEKQEQDEYWSLYHSLVSYYRQEDLYGLHSFSDDERWEFESMKKEMKDRWDE